MLDGGVITCFSPSDIDVRVYIERSPVIIDIEDVSRSHIQSIGSNWRDSSDQVSDASPTPIQHPRVTAIRDCSARPIRRHIVVQVGAAIPSTCHS